MDLCKYTVLLGLKNNSYQNLHLIDFLTIFEIIAIKLTTFYSSCKLY